VSFRDVEDTSLLAVLLEMGLLKEQDADALQIVLDEHRDRPEYEQLLGAYLVNKGAITAEDLELAEIHQKGLQDDNLLVQTRARVAMAKRAAANIRHRIRQNTELSEAILQDTGRLREKSKTGERLSLGALFGSLEKQSEK